MRLSEETCKGNNAACVTIIVPQSELVGPSRLCLKASNRDMWSYIQRTNRLDSGRICGVVKASSVISGLVSNITLSMTILLMAGGCPGKRPVCIGGRGAAPQR